MSHSLRGRADSTRVVSRMDLLIMYSMINSYAVNLTYVVVECISHHNQHPPVGAIFAGPCITRLVRGMNALGCIRSMERVGGAIPLGIQTLRAIGLLKCCGGIYSLTGQEESSSSDSKAGPRSIPPQWCQRTEVRQDPSLELATLTEIFRKFRTHREDRERTSLQSFKGCNPFYKDNRISSNSCRIHRSHTHQPHLHPLPTGMIGTELPLLTYLFCSLWLYVLVVG